MNQDYQTLLINFTNWLKTLNYSESTVYNQPNQLAEFLRWLETQNITKTKDITPQHGKDFIQHFTTRPNKRRTGGLSEAHINKQIDVLTKLSKYLKHTENQQINFKLQRLKHQATKPNILTKEEVKELYKQTHAADNYLLGIRDRAMLSIYYGCGLRKKEGLLLETTDIDFTRKLLYVRHPKNNYERYVPMSQQVQEDLEHYLYQARPLLLDKAGQQMEKQTARLFITEQGTVLTGQSIAYRLQVLQKKSSTLQEKKIGLHLLRHSIATHLLQAGMRLENIALFLGHKSLDSTQIYTHLAND